MASESDSGHDSDERHLERELFDPSDRHSDAATRAGDASADTGADARDWIQSFEEAAFGVDNSRASRTDTDDRTRAESRVAATNAAALGDMPTARRSRKRPVIVAAVVGLLVAGAAVGGVALIERNDRAKSSSGTSTTARSESSTTSRSRAVPPTTIAPAATTPPIASPSTPAQFTVRLNCAGRDCAVAVRQAPSTAAKNVGSLRAGQVVQISCSTHGESINDTNTGQRSDVWYRLVDPGGYSSAVYLEGPTVPDCE
jgi:Bacterial SH3 domain